MLPMSPAIKGGRVGGRRNPQGEPFDPAAVVEVRRAVMPSQGRGKGPRFYRNVEEVQLADGSVGYRCKHPDCRAILFKSASAAAMHRGAVHPGQSPRTADVERAAKKAHPKPEPAAELVPAEARLAVPAKPRRGRPPADPIVAQEAFLDAVARSTAGSIGEFLDQVLESRERAIEGRNVAQQEAVRLRQTLAEVQHHMTQINKLVQGIQG